MSVNKPPIAEQILIFGKPLNEVNLDELKNAVAQFHMLLRQYGESVTVLKAKVEEQKRQIYALRQVIARTKRKF